MINIKISLVNNDYMDEGNTLSYTLLPYLNKVEDYSFLLSDSNYTMSRFIKSLTTHIFDTECEVDKGFMICSLKFDSSRL